MGQTKRSLIRAGIVLAALISGLFMIWGISQWYWSHRFRAELAALKAEGYPTTIEDLAI